jgi:hypothetical protein
VVVLRQAGVPPPPPGDAADGDCSAGAAARAASPPDPAAVRLAVESAMGSLIKVVEARATRRQLAPLPMASGPLGKAERDRRLKELATSPSSTCLPCGAASLETGPDLMKPPQQVMMTSV